MPCRSLALRVTDRILAHRVAERHAGHPSLAAIIEHAIAQLHKYKAWSASFEATLARAKKTSQGLPEGAVWQDEFVAYWEPFTSIQRKMLTLFDAVETSDEATAHELEPYFDPPAHAQIEYATDSAEFFERAGYEGKQIAYSIQRLDAWHAHFTQWVSHATRELSGAHQKI